MLTTFSSLPTTQDLASFIVNCVSDESKVNQMLPIGGPGKAYTPKEQADLLFGLMGEKPKYFPVPISLMDGIIGIFDFLAKYFPSLEDPAEFGKIGRYYATESMLVYDPRTGTYDADATPEYGEDTLEYFFKNALEKVSEKDEKHTHKKKEKQTQDLLHLWLLSARKLFFLFSFVFSPFEFVLNISFALLVLTSSQGLEGQELGDQAVFGQK